MLMIGTVDLTDRAKYQFVQSDDGAGWEDADSPRRMVENGDTLIVSRSNKISDILNFLVICHGADEDDGDGAETSYQALRSECEAARLFTVTRGRRGAPKTVQKAIRGQSTPLVWSIRRYHLERVNHALGSLGLIPCKLMLVCVEGIPDLDPFPAPARFFLTGITPTVTIAPLEIIPAPAVFTLAGAVPTIDQASGPEVVPPPAVFTLAGPVPTIALEISAPPAVFTLAGPVPSTGSGGGDDVIRSSYGTRPAAGTAGTYWVATDTVLSAYDDGAVWQEYYGSIPLVNDGYPGTWVNQGSATIDTTLGGAILKYISEASDQIRARVKTAPGTPYSVTIGFIPTMIGGSFPNVGVCWRESGSGKLVTVSIPHGQGAGLWVAKWTNPTTFSADYLTLGVPTIPVIGPVVWVRLTDDGTNRKIAYSVDGVTFSEIHSVGNTDFITADQVGIYINTYQGVDVGVSTVANWLLSWNES